LAANFVFNFRTIRYSWRTSRQLCNTFDTPTQIGRLTTIVGGLIANYDKKHSWGLGRQL